MEGGGGTTSSRLQITRLLIEEHNLWGWKFRSESEGQYSRPIPFQRGKRPNNGQIQWK